MKTLNDTVEILVCFIFTWEIAQCLLSSLNTEMRLPQEVENSGKDAQCMGISGTLPKYSLCVWQMWSQSRCRQWQGSADSSGVFL